MEGSGTSIKYARWESSTCLSLRYLSITYAWICRYPLLDTRERNRRLRSPLIKISFSGTAVGYFLPNPSRKASSRILECFLPDFTSHQAVSAHARMATTQELGVSRGLGTYLASYQIGLDLLPVSEGTTLLRGAESLEGFPANIDINRSFSKDFVLSYFVPRLDCSKTIMHPV